MGKTVWGIIIILISVVAGLYSAYYIISIFNEYNGIMELSKMGGKNNNPPSFLLDPLKNAAFTYVGILAVSIVGSTVGTKMLKK